MQAAVSEGKQPVTGDKHGQWFGNRAVSAGNHETRGKRGKTRKQQQGQ